MLYDYAYTYTLRSRASLLGSNGRIRRCSRWYPKLSIRHARGAHGVETSRILLEEDIKGVEELPY